MSDLTLTSVRTILSGGELDGKRLPLIEFVDAQAKEIERLRDHLRAMCGWAVTRADQLTWTRDNANAFWVSYDAAIKATGGYADEAGDE